MLKFCSFKGRTSSLCRPRIFIAGCPRTTPFTRYLPKLCSFLDPSGATKLWLNSDAQFVLPIYINLHLCQWAGAERTSRFLISPLDGAKEGNCLKKVDSYFAQKYFVSLFTFSKTVSNHCIS